MAASTGSDDTPILDLRKDPYSAIIGRAASSMGRLTRHNF